MSIRMILIGVGLVLVGLAVSAQEDSSGVDSATVIDSTAAPGRFIVRCQRLLVDDMQLQDTLEVTLESFGRPIGGFDLKIAADSRYLAILDVLPGEIYDSCGWEYFRAFQVATLPEDGRPSMVWKAVALSKASPDTTEPECLTLEGQKSMIRLVVSSAHVSEPIPDTVAPLFFYWETCSDNVLSDDKGTSLMMSTQVFDYLDRQMPADRALFPTRLGAPRQCIDPSRPNRPKRAVEFHNGGIEFRYEPGPISTDSAQ